MILMSIFVLILICKIQIMKRILILFSILAVLVSCERPDLQDEVSYAVVSGKKVSSIETGFIDAGSESILYTYEYGLSGNVSKVIKQVIGTNTTPLDEYVIFYSEGEIESIEGSEYRWDYFHDDDGYLKRYTISGRDMNRIKYSYEFIWRENTVYGCFINDDMDNILYHYLFKWNDGNMVKKNSTSHEYSTILDNFNIAIPFDHCEMTQCEDVFFNDALRSDFLPSEISDQSDVVKFSYERNIDGDICRINVGEEIYYQIEYCDVFEYEENN